MVSMKALAVALAVVVGALSGFYGGFHAGRGSAATGGAAAATGSAGLTAGRDAGAGGSAGTGAPGGAGGFAGGAGRGATVGTITGLSADGFTLHAAGGDVRVSLGSGITVRRTADASVSDLQNNLTVTVAGQRNSDGTLAASGITILPAGAAPGGGG